MVHLEEVFRRLRKADVKLNPKKCRFVKQKVEYLGNVVIPEGVSPNPGKVHVVQEFPTPPNVKEPFLLFVDARSMGISFALAQVQNGKESVIAYNGCGLTKAESNCSTTEREALALVEGTKKFQPYPQQIFLLWLIKVPCVGK